MRKGLILLIVASLLFVGSIVLPSVCQPCKPCIDWDAFNPFCQAAYAGCIAAAQVCFGWYAFIGTILQVLAIIVGLIGIILLVFGD